MRRSTAGILIVFLGLVLQVGIAAQERISASEAAKYVGKNGTVCGQVASATDARRSRGRPTFLNLDRPYRNQIFTVLIWGDNRGKFPTPPEKADNRKKICGTGMIVSYRAQPQII